MGVTRTFMGLCANVRQNSGNLPVSFPLNTCRKAVTRIAILASSSDANRHPDGLPDTQPDTVWNYELGTLTFADHRVTVNGAIYQVDWKDMQSQVFLQSLDPSGRCTYDRLVNVGNATVRGAEVAVMAQVRDGVRVEASMA